MKRSMKKFMVTCAAVSAIAAVTSASAMAANYDAATNSATYTVPTAAADTQMTVLVIPEAAEAAVTDDAILWIDQDAPVSGTAMLKGDSLEDGTYLVKVGYYKEDGSFAIAEETFKIGEDIIVPEYTLGDVNADEMIDSQDSLMILEYEVGNSDLTDIQKLAADTNKDEMQDSQDSLLILEYEVGNISGF